MTKNPAYIIPLVGLYIFSFGYVYEWGYLSEFGVAYQVVNHTYDEFLVLATHAMTVALRTGNAVSVIFLSSLFIGIVYSISQANFYKKWLQKGKEKRTEVGDIFASIFII